MTAFYRVHEFAELAGVTVKALHHYDRLGLLKPRRTDAGYRLYTERDMERLEQIVALKFLGLPLKQIKVVLDRTALELPDALRLQRRALEEKQQLLVRAISAIQEAERAIEPGQPAHPLILKKLIEAINMQDSVDVMKKYYSDEAWAKWKGNYEREPSREWKDLYREVEAVLGEDPACERAQALAIRWMELVQRDSGGDPEVQGGLLRAWEDRENWPAAMQQRTAKYNLEKLAPFIGKAMLAHRKKYYGEEAWAKVSQRTPEERRQISIAWSALLFEVGNALEEDPAGEKAQALAARWRELAGRELGGDPAVREGSAKAWADRENWPAVLRERAAQFQNAAAFIGKANAYRVKTEG